MRVLFLAALVVLPLLAAPSATAATSSATLSIEVAADRSERMTLVFEGLATNTEYRSICLPARANPTSVSDGKGALAHTLTQAEDRVSLTFQPRTPTVTIEMKRTPTREGTPPLYTSSANFCTTEESRVVVTATAAAPLEMFFASAPGVVADGVARWESAGPNFVTYAYETPLAVDAGMAVVEQAPFRMFAPADHVREARELAIAAAPALRDALRAAGLGMPWTPLRVHFSARDEFSWEAGHYGADGIIAVKPSTLVNDSTEGFPYVGAKVLVHEAFHAASAPYGKGEVDDVIAWWLEGTARHAERQVDGVLPGASRHCQTTGNEVRCWFFDDRISREDLATGYSPSFEFERRWEASVPQSEDTRRFYYAFSEYLVAAYVAQAGEDAYQAVWDELTAAFADPARCPCGDGWLEGVLLAEAGNLTVDDLYRPWADERAADQKTFDARVASLVRAPQEVPNPPLFALPIPGLGALGLVVALAAALAVRRR